MEFLGTFIVGFVICSVIVGVMKIWEYLKALSGR